MVHKFFVAFIPMFVAIDPIGLVAVFMGLAGDTPREQRQREGFVAIFTALFISVGFIFLGKIIFTALGITVADFQVAGGLILLGIAGRELLMIEVCVEQAAGRVPVIAGCGSNDTMNALLHMNFSKKCGAQAALLVAPYYNRPSQEGLLAHFGYLAEHSDLPIVLYNVPGRTVTDLKPETVCELVRRYPGRIAGIKDASGDLSRVTDHRMGIGGDFCQLSGDDELALPHYAAGGVGCISVTANVAPRLCADFQQACADNDLAKARELNDRLYPLHYAMFEDASPGPCKYALSKVHGWMTEDLRLPLVPCGAEARVAVGAALAHAGLVGAEA